MKVIKNVLILAFFMISFFCSAQMFSVKELINLSEDNVDSFKNLANDRGYTNGYVMDNGFSTSYEYTTRSGNSIISLIIPSNSETRMLTWDFKLASCYQEIKSQLENGGYALINTEKRNNGKYLALYYSLPGFDIILTSDQTTSGIGKYIFSVKTSELTETVPPTRTRTYEEPDYSGW